MRIIETIILGIIQGIAEFLPISSSAHLIIFRDVFGVGSFIAGNMEMSFDIALHFGTFLAILVYFFKDFWKYGNEFGYCTSFWYFFSYISLFP